MRKKNLLALLLALMMILSGCALVSKDEAKDNAQVIVDVNGETVDKATVSSMVSYTLEQNVAIYQNAIQSDVIAQYYASQGIDINSLALTEASVRTQVIDSYVNNLVYKQKAYELGMGEMTEEELAEIQENAKADYDSFISSVASTYLPDSTLEGEELAAAAEKFLAENNTFASVPTLEDYIAQATDEKAIEKLQNSVIDEVEVTDEEIAASFDEKVEAAKASMEATPDLYTTSRMSGYTVYYTPAGYRMVKHILITTSEEDDQVIEEKQTALNDAKTALENAAEDADKDALQAAVDAAQAELEEAQAVGLANAKARADEVYALATAEGADFDALISEYSVDVMPSEGYPIREGSTTFVSEFVEGAMALENVGDISEPVETEYGYHIIKYDADVEEGPVDLASVRDDIAAELKTSKQNQALADQQAKWLQEAEAVIKTYPDRLD